MRCETEKEIEWKRGEGDGSESGVYRYIGCVWVDDIRVCIRDNMAMLQFINI